MGWITDTGNALGSLIGSVGSAVAAVGNSGIGSAATGIIASKMGVNLPPGALSQSNVKPTGEGYTIPLTSTLFNFYELTPTKMFVLDSSFNRSLNWVKVLVVAAPFIGLFFLAKKKRWI